MEDSSATLRVIFGDQLDIDSVLLREADAKCDLIWMAEVEQEITYVPSHKQRIAFFLSAMRHFRDELIRRKYRVHYHELSAQPSCDRASDFASLLKQDIQRYEISRIVVVQPGDYRVAVMLEDVADTCRVELQILEDTHFYQNIAEFVGYARGKKSLLLENYYRGMRRKHGILMDRDGQPEGGSWNYDQDNRKSFGKDVRKLDFHPWKNTPDGTDEAVLRLVDERFARHPGSLSGFQLPTTRAGARRMLRHFIQYGLPKFGTYEDAMLSAEPFTFHSRLSALLNVKLLNPRECVDAAVAAYHEKRAPLNSVEGFVRQILGWREFIRGIYWNFMPEYADRNFFGCREDLPELYWTGRTQMNCLKHAMAAVLEYGYAHHIQRLMVLGLFALLYGVRPREFHDWHMAMYVDAVDWVSLPNTLGMSQYGDGGVVGTKPYCASGNYINKMSDYCGRCPYKYKEASGEKACPITTLYWEFLHRHERKLQSNMRLKFAMKGLERKKADAKEFELILKRAKDVRALVKEAKL
ncbi:MAG: cryptochrome/photolyase family protein [Candidatus Omnitrophica bacterium]|nr:cryptochrome/photolyase family protein [Candidatus Omnitrophota bacterium]MCB9720352.1 cryptochrome/photolyase family protein [Candidatus Omnitrophota bacterium]